MTHQNVAEEIEIKLPITDPGAAAARLQGLQAKVKTARYFEDNLVYDTQEGNIRGQGMLLRVRVVDGQEAVLTFKGRADTSKGVKQREELETRASSGPHLMAILNRLGYVVIFRYQKYRTTYEIAEVPLEFCIDETPIGNYLELEGDIEAIHRYAQMLGFSPKDYITDSYGSLYYLWCTAKGVAPSNMTFP